MDILLFLKRKAAHIALIAVVGLVFLTAQNEAQTTSVSGNIVDVVNSVIYPGTLVIRGGKIADIVKEDKAYGTYIIPGLVDSHVHIESSLLVPSEFARLAVVHGTVATVSDPHEIANVMGVQGVEYMLASAATVPFKFYFGASSCVPATEFETAGARLGVKEVERLLHNPQIKYLSEVMNYPGVINADSEVIEKIELARSLGKPVDGHAPGLMGKDLEIYAAAGITTDHETITLKEGLEKIKLGMKVQIREGSAAKNFAALHTLIVKYPDRCMFCTDDLHPDDLAAGHINRIVKRALKLGYDKMAVLRCATLNPVKHYGLDVGLLQKGDSADFVIIDNFTGFNILRTYIGGRVVAAGGKSLLQRSGAKVVNNFNAHQKNAADFMLKKEGSMINVINAINGQLLTRMTKEVPKVSGPNVISDTDRDILKLVNVNRYEDNPPAIGFVKSFGLKKGAVASSFAHDSHNVIALGASDEEIALAVNAVIRNKGGLALAYDGKEDFLSLPIAGLMTNEDGYEVAKKYSTMTIRAKELGSNLTSPYITLSFMALLVMPEVKLSDKGLFDGKEFKFIDIFEN